MPGKDHLVKVGCLGPEAQGAVPVPAEAAAGHRERRSD